jgi:hypothetical protein
VLLGLTNYYGSVQRYLGLLHGVTGDWDDAVASSEAAVEVQEGVRAAATNIATRQQLAWALVRRGGPGDHARAAHQRERAIAFARAIGADSHDADPWAFPTRPSTPETGRAAANHVRAGSSGRAGVISTPLTDPGRRREDRPVGSWRGDQP